MNTLMMRICLPLILLAMALENVSAADADTSGAVGAELAQGLYCSTGNLLEGNVGLALGLLLVFSGVWSLVKGGKVVAALPVIIMGSLMTALPSLIASGFEGLGSLLQDGDVNIALKTFETPDCSSSVGTAPDGSSMPTANEMDDAYSDKNGVFYPGRGSYYPVLPEVGPVPTPRPPNP